MKENDSTGTPDSQQVKLYKVYTLTNPTKPIETEALQGISTTSKTDTLQYSLYTRLVNDNQSKALTYTSINPCIEEDLILTNKSELNSNSSPTCFSELNRSDLVEIQEYSNFLEYDQRQMLKKVVRKKEIYPYRFHDGYLERSALLILSGYSRSLRYSFCSVKNINRMSQPCKRHHFCSYCNWLSQQTALQTLLPSFERGKWYHVTLSFNGCLTATPEATDYILNCWKACGNALKAAVDEKLLKGAYWTEELSVQSFLPNKVLPHVHALVDADDICQNTLDYLEELMTKALGRVELHGDGLQLTPNILVQATSTECRFLHTIKYLFKTLEILPKYQLAWKEVEETGRSVAVSLNSAVREFLDLHFELTNGRDRKYAKGNLHPQSAAFIGVKKCNRKDFREYVRLAQTSYNETPTVDEE